MLLALALLASTWLANPAIEARSYGSVEGRIQAASELPERALVAAVVYLEPQGFELAPVRAKPAAIHQRGARFHPEFLVVDRGARLDMPNDDPILHNVFSYSPGDEFDLGLYGQGEVRGVTLERPGAIRVYCSIHESMNGTVFVAPNRLHDVVRAGGRFFITEVPPGRYRVRLWSPRLPELEREVEVQPGAPTRVDLALPDAASP